MTCLVEEERSLRRVGRTFEAPDGRAALVAQVDELLAVGVGEDWVGVEGLDSVFCYFVMS